eukprot:COSAG02_NODE_4265_length_5572_cov_3.251416_8_plen_468_part_00
MSSRRAAALVVAVLLLTYPLMLIWRRPHPHGAAAPAKSSREGSAVSSPLSPHTQVLQTIAARYPGGSGATWEHKVREGVSSARQPVVRLATAGLVSARDAPVVQADDPPPLPPLPPLPPPVSARDAPVAQADDQLPPLPPLPPPPPPSSLTRPIDTVSWPCRVRRPAGSWSPAPPPLASAKISDGASLVEAQHEAEVIWSDCFQLWSFCSCVEPCCLRLSDCSVGLRRRNFDSSTNCTGYKHFTVSQAEALLRGKQVVFAGDSLMRKLYYEFTQSSVILSSVSPHTYKSKKDKTILRVEDMDFSTQFIWAPYAKRRNKDLGGDSRTVFPYEAILGELFSSQPPSEKTLENNAKQSYPLQLEGRTQEVGEGAAAELCRVGVGQGRHQTWDRFCARPSALVLSVGLWQTESWQSNVGDFSAMIRAEEAKAQAAGRPPLKIIVLLPFPVRRIRSDIPSSGLQEDSNVEKQ